MGFHVFFGEALTTPWVWTKSHIGQRCLVLDILALGKSLVAVFTLKFKQIDLRPSHPVKSLELLRVTLAVWAFSEFLIFSTFQTESFLAAFTLLSIALDKSKTHKTGKLLNKLIVWGVNDCFQHLNTVIRFVKLHMVDAH